MARSRICQLELLSGAARLADDAADGGGGGLPVEGVELEAGDRYAFVFTIIALVLYPHAPTYTVCNSELDWSTVFSSLAHLTIGADYRVAISVNNGNRFGIVLDSLVAEFDFDEESVATIDFKETIELVPAAITDVVVPIKFAAASALQAATIYSAYRAGTLTFKANANIKGTAAGFYSFEMDIKDHVVDMSADMDLSLCSACHES